MFARSTLLPISLAIAGLPSVALAQTEAPPLPPLEDVNRAVGYDGDQPLYQPAYQSVPIGRGYEETYDGQLRDAGQSAGWQAGWIEQCSASLPYTQCADYLSSYLESYTSAYRNFAVQGSNVNGGVMWVRAPAATATEPDCR